MTLPCSKVELRVYERDAFTLRDTVSFNSGLSWVDPLGDMPSAALSVPLVQSIMQSDPGLLDDAIIKVATNNVVGFPDSMNEFIAFLCEGGEYTLIGPGEDADFQRGLQCRGVLGLLDGMVVYPEGGFRDVAGDKRFFGWMSAAGDWYDVTAWTGTIAGTKWSSVSSTSDRYKKPKGWPDKNAYWVGCGSTFEKQYLRSEFTVSDDTAVRVVASADENLRVYLDSDLIIKNNSNEVGYTELNHWRGILSAGTHTIGVHFLQEHHYASWGLGYDVTDRDRAIVSVYAINQNGDYQSLIRHTNSTTGKWVGIGVNDPDRPPSWTAAAILGALVDEASARGSQIADRLLLDFTATVDSDGTSWADVQEKSWPIGTKLSKVAADLGEHDVDWDMAPDLTLHGYVNQGSDVSGSVALRRGVNITALKCTVTPPAVTALLIRSANRWVEVSDDVTGDRIEGFLQTGGSASRAQAKHHGDKVLEGSSIERRLYTCEFIATTGCVPYQDFGKGDTITCPNRYNIPSQMRVMSISGSCPDDGPIRWTVELEPLDAVEVLVPWNATGYTYYETVTGDTGDYSAPTYDDHLWPTNGHAPFGSDNEGGHDFDAWGGYNTSWPIVSRIWLRRSVTVPADAKDLTVYVRLDNHASIYWNGALLETFDHIVGHAEDYDNPWSVVVPNHLVNLGGTNLLAVQATDDSTAGADKAVIDVEVTCVVTA